MIEKRFDADDKRPIIGLYWDETEWAAQTLGDNPSNAKRIDVVLVAACGGYSTWFEVELNDGRVLQHNAAFVESVERSPLPKP